jgi:hypothetical protein
VEHLWEKGNNLYFHLILLSIEYVIVPSILREFSYYIMHEQENIQEQKRPSRKGPIALALGGVATLAAVVAFWPVWKQKTFDFSVACPEATTPQVTAISESNDHPFTNVTCPEGTPAITAESGDTATTEYTLALATSHTLGQIESNHLKFTIHKDPAQAHTMDVTVNSNDLVFIDGATINGS